jgi:hypothetical protein
MDGRTCVSVGGCHLMLMHNLEDAARAIQPDEDPDPIVSMPDNLGLVESRPTHSVRAVHRTAAESAWTQHMEIQ